MKLSTLQRIMQEQITVIRKIDPENCNSEVAERKQQIAKTLTYMCNSQKGIIKDCELEKRLEALEKRYENEQ